MTAALVDTVHALYRSSTLTEHQLGATVLHRTMQRTLGTPRRSAPPTASVTVDASLPRLAWGCTVRDGEHRFRIGSGVERGDEFIFEGVWDGDFAAGRVHRTDFAFGSGARMGKFVVFVPPKHCWEYLYVVVDRKTSDTHVSNSAVYALVGAGLMPDHPFTQRVFTDLRRSTDEASAAGIDRYEPLVAQDDRYAFYRMMFHNFMVVGGTIQVIPTASSQYFNTFPRYRAFLSRIIERLAANGRHPGRASALTPITPLSSGYDSTAAAVLASELGYRDAVTQVLNVRGTHDSGESVGAALGMKVAVTRHLLGTDPLQTLRVSVSPDELDLYGEFLATAGLGDDVMLGTMSEHLPNRIMLSGAMGDSVWRRKSTLPPGLPVRVIYGKSFTEFRLRVGYAFVPVPAIGARFPQPIRRITRLPGMAPWTLNQAYDRPIARRIAEQAGLQRGTFAVGKAAANPTPSYPDALTLAAVSAVARRYA